jgi:DNA-binding CsgD family transcriptional regulator
MAVFDPTQFSAVRNVFPELSNVQFETTVLYAIGLSQKEIADMRGVSLTSAKRTLETAREQYSLSSLSCLRSIFHVRLFLHLFQEDIWLQKTPGQNRQHRSLNKRD